jgi:TRAP-type C4-dicarboxylate transport system substrate-binding protein
VTGQARRSVGQARVLIASALALAALPGCGGSLTTKAGGRERDRQATVLTMVVADGGQARTVFADGVRRLSHGTLRIEIRTANPSALGVSQLQAERRDIARVERGDIPMAWLPSRIWESEGVASFRALWAPFVVTSHALLWKIVSSLVAREMLRGTEKRGVVGLALVPVDLRRVLGRERPLVSLAAFRGARVATYSPTEAEVLRALGAIPRLDVAPVDNSLRERRIDGVEAGAFYILVNGYAHTAPYVPANVVLFARTDVIAINKRAFDGLTPGQRASLREAARQTVRAQRHLGDTETQLLEGLCELGARFGVATKAQLAQLEEAERPVYDELARDPEVRGYLEQIQAIKRRTAPDPPLKIPAGCAA